MVSLKSRPKSNKPWGCYFYIDFEGNLKEEKVKKALEGTLFLVSVYEDDELIGLGRIVGDGGVTFVVSDIMVDKKFQRRGIANRIMEMIDQWFDENTHESSFITLLAKVPADKLYRKHHFCYLDENRVGMIREK